MKPRHVRILAPAFAFVLLFTSSVFSSCRQNVSNPPERSDPPVQSENDLPGHDQTVHIGGITPYGLRYEGTAECSKLSVAELSDSSEECLRMFAQYMTSVVSYDFSLHVPLFQQEVLDQRLYAEFDRVGYTTEQALARIRENAAELLGIYLFDVNYEVVGLTVNDPAQREALLNYLPQDMDTASVGDVLNYRIANMRLLINDTLLIHIDDAYDIEETGVCFYRYQDAWYLTPTLLENDFSIDLLQADPASDHYYHTASVTGTVAAVENRIVFLEEYPGKCYLLPADAVLPVVGDPVELSYYDKGSRMSGEHCIDGTPLEMYQISSQSYANDPKTPV